MKGEGVQVPPVRINAAGTVRCEAEWNWAPSPAGFTDYDLWYVWAGRGWMELSDATRVELRPGFAGCLRPGQPPRHARHDPANRLGVSFVHFDFLAPGGRPRRRSLPPGLPPVWTQLDYGATNVFFEMTLRRLVELFHVGGPRARREAACYLQGLLEALRSHRLSGAAARGSQGTSSPALADARERLGEVVRHVRENPAETFRMASLAARAHYSADHFSRLFTAIYGRSPKEFCIEVRLERAKRLLAESDLTVDQVARNLGYGDVFFFSRQFKRRVGLPPTAWRAATR